MLIMTMMIINQKRTKAKAKKNPIDDRSSITLNTNSLWIGEQN